jgi:hypothetical protein
MRSAWLHCDDCGRQRVPMRKLTLLLNEARRVFQVCWRCRTCGRATANVISDREARRLVRRGVRPETLRLSLELREPRPDLGALSLVDVEHWRTELHSPGRLEDAVADLDDGSRYRY